MRRLKLEPTPLAGLMRVRRECIGDARGNLTRVFCADELRAAGWTHPIAQVNHTHTVHCGTVRGLHYQRAPTAEAKLVSCLQGEVWDVAVDLRQGSTTFMQWFAERLSKDNGVALLIPPGFAHGFQALSDAVDMLYCHDRPHTPADEGGVHPSEMRLALPWPMPVTGLSARDAAHPPLAGDFAGLVLGDFS